MSAAVSVRVESRKSGLSNGLLRDWFYFFMSLLIAVIVVYGFSQRAEMQLIHPLHRKPMVM